MRQSIAFLILTIWALQISAQDDLCAVEPDKKTQGLYEKALNRKKYDKKQRTSFLKQIIDHQPDYLEALFLYSKTLAAKYIYTKMPFESLSENFIKIKKACPGFHSEIDFFLAQHYLNSKDYEKALEYLKAFIAFQSDDESKFSKLYDKYLTQAKSDLEYAEFYGDTYINPKPFNPVLVAQASTKADEYLPSITADNAQLFFTRRSQKEYKKNNGVVVRDQVFSDAAPKLIETYMASTLEQNKSFGKGVPLPSPFNETEGVNYGGSSLTIDNKEMYVTICNPTQIKGREYNNCDIYYSKIQISHAENGEKIKRWGALEKLGKNINGPDTWEAQPSISSDGKTLFFASARPDSKGIDIYVSQKDETHTWQPAVNVGAPINTALNDKSPFMHNDSKTLYYASQGHLGFGGYDVFYTRFEKGEWSKPKNIGFPINTKKDEHGFVINLDGDKVYYSSDINADKDKGLDLFTFELYKEARPKKVVLVKGTIEDEKREIPKDASVELKNAQTGEVSKAKVDLEDGSYAAVIAAEDSVPVIVNVKSAGKVFSSRLIPSKEKASVQHIDTKLEELVIGKAFQIKDIFYATNSSEIDKESELILIEFAAYLKENASLEIAIYGHTDNIGSTQNNLALSTDRAFNVKSFLQQKGINGSRIEFKGFGEQKPIASNQTEIGRAKNRRTEFVILKK